MNAVVQRSTFITVLAWIFIILSGFTTLISLLQNIMLHIILNTPEVERAMHNMPPETPYVTRFMFGHFRLFIFIILVLSMISLAASIGLLKRKNWARILFIAFSIFSILWNAGGLVLQLFAFSSMRGYFNMPEAAPLEMNALMGVMQVFTAIVAIGFAVLFGWITKRLMSTRIKAEFTSQTPQTTE